jgi:hypothetical protein
MRVRTAAVISSALVVIAGCSSASSDVGGTPVGRQSSSGSTASATDAAASSSHRVTLNPNHNYGDLYKNGLLPVGDGHYTDNKVKKGYVDACATYVQALAQGGGGAQARGPWFKDGNNKYQVKQKSTSRATFITMPCTRSRSAAASG